MTFLGDLKKAEAAADKTIKKIQTPGLWLPNQDMIFEQIVGEKFLLSDGQIKKEIPSNINGEDIIFVSIPESQVSWELCTQTNIKQSDKNKLWRYTREFIYRNVDLPDPRLYDVLTAWVFATWTQEIWDAVPYIFFLGMKASGKTRALETLQLLTFRGKMTVSSTPAALFRSIEKYNCIPFLDEAEVYNQEEKAEIRAMLNAGQKRRSAKVERCQEEHGNQTIKTFNIFGFKAIAGTESLKPTLESRSIIINMSKSTRPLDNTQNIILAQRLRNGLLLYRFQTLTQINQITQKPTISDDDSYDAYDTYDAFDAKTNPTLKLPPEFESIRNGRVRELFYPLYQVAEGEARKKILDYAKTVDEQHETEENLSIEAEILLAILNCRDKVENGILPRIEIENYYNFNHSKQEELHDRRLTSKLKALGFNFGRTSTKRGIIWDTKKLIALCKRFKFDPKDYNLTDDKSPLLEASQVSQASQTSTAKPATSKFISKKIESIFKKDPENPDKKLCSICSEYKPIAYTIAYEDGTFAEACSKCGLSENERWEKQKHSINTP